MAKPSRFDVATRQAIVAAYEVGWPLHDIANQYGVDKSYPRRLAAGSGAVLSNRNRARRPWPADAIERLKRIAQS